MPDGADPGNGGGLGLKEKAPANDVLLPATVKSRIDLAMFVTFIFKKSSSQSFSLFLCYDAFTSDLYEEAINNEVIGCCCWRAAAARLAILISTAGSRHQQSGPRMSLRYMYDMYLGTCRSTFFFLCTCTCTVPWYFIFYAYCFINYIFLPLEQYSNFSALVSSSICWSRPICR